MREKTIEAIVEILRGIRSNDLLERICAFVIHVADIDSKRP